MGRRGFAPAVNQVGQHRDNISGRFTDFVRRYRLAENVKDNGKGHPGILHLPRTQYIKRSKRSDCPPVPFAQPEARVLPCVAHRAARDSPTPNSRPISELQLN